MKPTLGVQFILHILLSMGHFATEIDLTLHPTIRESLRYAKLIGPNDDEASLQQYANDLIRRFIEEQLVYFANARRVIDSWIVVVKELLYSVIIHDFIPINNLPSVQQTALYATVESETKTLMHNLKLQLIECAFTELTNVSLTQCNVPTKQDLIIASKSTQLQWNAFYDYTKSPAQPQSSFEEQKLAIKVCCDTVDAYVNGMYHNKFI